MDRQQATFEQLTLPNLKMWCFTALKTLNKIFLLKGLRHCNCKIIFVTSTKITDMLIFVLKTQISQNLLRSGLIHFQTTSPRCECYPRTWIFYLFGCLCKDQRFLYNTLQYLFYERLETSKGYHLLCQFQTDSFFHVLGRHLSAFGKCFFFFFCISILRPVVHQNSATLCLPEVAIFLSCFNDRSV